MSDCTSSNNAECSSASDFSNLEKKNHDFEKMIECRDQESTSLDFNSCCAPCQTSCSSEDSERCKDKKEGENYVFNCKPDLENTDKLFLINVDKDVKIEKCEECTFSGVCGKKEFSGFKNTNVMDHLYCLESLSVGEIKDKKNDYNLNVHGSTLFDGKVKCKGEIQAKTVKIDDLIVNKITNRGKAEYYASEVRKDGYPTVLDFTPQHLPEILYVDTSLNSCEVVLGSDNQHIFANGQRVTIKNASLAAGQAREYSLVIRLPYQAQQVKIEYFLGNGLTCGHEGRYQLPAGGSVTFIFHQFSSVRSCWMIEQIFSPPVINRTSLVFPHATEKMKYALLNKKL